jgi:hypothetical protein
MKGFSKTLNTVIEYFFGKRTLRETSLILIISAIILLSILLVIIKYIPIREGFISVPRVIPLDSRDRVSECLDLYVERGNKICPVQNVVIESIAKTLMGVGNGTPTKADLAKAFNRAKSMAMEPLFNCANFQTYVEIINKDELNIKDLYEIFDNIPDNIGTIGNRTVIFCVKQLQETYDKIQSTLSSAASGKVVAPAPSAVSTKTEPFANVNSPSSLKPPTEPPLPSHCKSTEKCPEEMAYEIQKRLDGIIDNIKNTKYFTYKNLEVANDLISKLNTIKKQAEAGDIRPTAAAPLASAPPTAASSPPAVSA